MPNAFSGQPTGQGPTSINPLALLQMLQQQGQQGQQQQPAQTVDQSDRGQSVVYPASGPSAVTGQMPNRSAFGAGSTPGSDWNDQSQVPGVGSRDAAMGQAGELLNEGRAYNQTSQNFLQTPPSDFSNQDQVTSYYNMLTQHMQSMGWL